MISFLASYLYRDRILHHIHAEQPPLPRPGTCDAVIRLGGGNHRRRPASLLAAARTLAPVIFTQDLEPRPGSTPAEAEAIAIHARGWSWKCIVLVTDRFHMARALWLFRRALPGVRVVPFYSDFEGDQSQVDAEARRWLGDRLRNIF